MDYPLIIHGVAVLLPLHAPSLVGALAAKSPDYSL